MRIDGDLLPSQSGQSNLGVDGPAIDGASITPFGRVHQNSGVFHDAAVGGSGIIRFDAAAGQIQQSVDGGKTFSAIGAGGGGTPSRSLVVEIPGASEDIGLFYTDEAIEVSKMVAVLTGAIDASGTWTIRHSTDRSAAGNEVVTGGTITTNRTTGDIITSFDDPTIPASSFVWFETTGVSGIATDSIQVDLFF